MLLSLAITLLIVGSLTPLYRLVKYSHNSDDYDVDIYIAVKQVSQYLIGAYTLDIGDAYQYIDINNQTRSFVLDHHRLVRKPGFEILLTNIDDLSFSIQNDWVYMHLTSDQKSYHFLVGYNRIKEIEDEKDE